MHPKNVFTLFFNLRNNSIENNGIMIQTLKRTTTQKKCMELKRVIFVQWEKRV